MTTALVVILALASSGCSGTTPGATGPSAASVGGPPSTAPAATAPRSSAAPATTPVRAAPSATTFEIDGRTVQLACDGRGHVPVVFIAGGMDPGTKWEPVLTRLPGDVLHCSFDRPGVGGSEPAPQPLSPSGVADLLDATLTAAGLDGPAVLVGHSLGGITTAVFGSEHPTRLAGAVLVDATVVVSLTAEDRQLLTAMGYDPDVLTADAAAATQWPDVPLRVLRHDSETMLADQQFGFTPKDEDDWRAGQQRYAELSSESVLLEVPGTGHDIYIYDPDSVVEAIAQVLAELR